ncbi:MAG: hypothetical protein KC591_15875 [Gemmatimonadetes bacterium]|nr:hypothetical protein [Gemmatimonadota bacterium]
MRRNVLACSATILAFLIPADALAATFFVDPTAPGADDGSSWADAFADLQSALALATNGDEIRVAGGTYVPGPTRSDTFRLPSGVVTRGSFGGYSSPEPDARDFDATPSILSGEIGTPTRDDNCYSVVDASGTAAGTTLDGFVVTRGHAWGGGTERGGGLYTNLGSPTLRDVRFADNVSRWHGAGDLGGRRIIKKKKKKEIIKIIYFIRR